MTIQVLEEMQLQGALQIIEALNDIVVTLVIEATQTIVTA